LARFTPRVSGGSAFYVRRHEHHKKIYHKFTDYFGLLAFMRWMFEFAAVIRTTRSRTS
jgi:hypothetical protein